ncbi:MAG TPA: M14 family zinc carboxypeptidase, partial [Polyangiaceae bacterium]|nr:M14 family zinc carboxypeptidase [Polyangiaceae bacterium]
MSAAPVANRDPSLAVLDEGIEKHGGEPLVRATGPRGLGPYRGYAEVLGVLRNLAARGARIVPIGRSVRGEPLLSVQLGNANPGVRARTSVVLAGLHPIEWIGVESALALLGMLVNRDLGDRAVFAVPIANPDGFLHVERNLRLKRRRLVRHNARGVDLNRNFDCRWGKKNLPARLV